MIIFYDGDRDYAEVFFNKEENYGDSLNDGVTAFKAEKNDKIVGYGFEEASRRLFENDLISPNVKLAVLLRIVRVKKNLLRSKLQKKFTILHSAIINASNRVRRTPL